MYRRRNAFMLEPILKKYDHGKGFVVFRKPKSENSSENRNSESLTRIKLEKKSFLKNENYPKGTRKFDIKNQ
jgi:hypothetical protein